MKSFLDKIQFIYFKKDKYAKMYSFKQFNKFKYLFYFSGNTSFKDINKCIYLNNNLLSFKLFDSMEQIDYIFKNFLNASGTKLNIKFIQEKFFFDFNKKKNISIEICSANPTGKLQIGNLRIAFNSYLYYVFNKLVERDKYFSCYFLNDLGKQTDKLLNNFFFFRNNRLSSDALEYLDIIQILDKKLSKQNNINKNILIDNVFDCISDQLKDYNITIDYVFKESIICNNIDYEIIDILIDNVKLIGEKYFFFLNKNEKFLFNKKDKKTSYLFRDLVFLNFLKKKQLIDKHILFLGTDHLLHSKFLLFFAKKIKLELQINFLEDVCDKNSNKISKRKGNSFDIDNFDHKFKKSIFLFFITQRDNKYINIDFMSNFFLKIKNFIVNFDIFEKNYIDCNIKIHYDILDIDIFVMHIIFTMISSIFSIIYYGKKIYFEYIISNLFIVLSSLNRKEISINKKILKIFYIVKKLFFSFL